MKYETNSKLFAIGIANAIILTILSAIFDSTFEEQLRSGLIIGFFILFALVQLVLIGTKVGEK